MTTYQLSVISYQLSVRRCWGFGVLVEISLFPYLPICPFPHFPIFLSPHS
ncbi:MAG: hypothetical protein GPJ10_17320 [Microcystis aeruginosa L211-07]|nr:hypothetical protein [Microcystis aeruginosa L211-07]